MTQSGLKRQGRRLHVVHPFSRRLPLDPPNERLRISGQAYLTASGDGADLPASGVFDTWMLDSIRRGDGLGRHGRGQDGRMARITRSNKSGNLSFHFVQFYACFLSTIYPALPRPAS